MPSPSNLSELIEMFLNIKQKRENTSSPKLYISDRDIEIILKILIRTRKNVLNHGRTAIDEKEEIEGMSEGMLGGVWFRYFR